MNAFTNVRSSLRFLLDRLPRWVDLYVRMNETRQEFKKSLVSGQLGQKKEL